MVLAMLSYPRYKFLPGILSMLQRLYKAVGKTGES